MAVLVLPKFKITLSFVWCTRLDVWNCVLLCESASNEVKNIIVSSVAIWC